MGSSTSAQVPAHVDTIPRLVQHWAETMPDKELFVFYAGQVRSAYSCRQVLEMAGKFAGRLRGEYGMQKGDVIVNLLPNSPERLFTDLGIILAGCIAENGSIMFTDGQDFLTAARNSGVVAVVACPEATSSAWTILKRYVTRHDSPATAALKCDLVPTITSAILVSRHYQGQRISFLEELQDSQEEVFVEPDIRADDVFYALTTSGTSGYCKLVSKTHAESIEMWTMLRTVVGQQSRNVWPDNLVVYNDRPIAWMGGFPYGTYVAADKRVLLDVFDSEGSKVGVDSWAIICREKVDYAIVMPLDLDPLLKSVSVDTSYKMKIIFCGGQPILKMQYIKYLTLAHEVGVVYGSTEAGFLSFGVVPETGIRDYFCHKLRPGIQVQVVDEAGQQVKTGQLGTIEVTGEKMFFRGYLNVLENPDPKTLTSFTKDGWFKMGDSGFFDEDGHLYVLGRLKDVIIFGATNVQPTWLECKIVDLPGVAEACVVPVSDPILYQNICAIVKPVPGSGLTEEQVRAYFEGMFINSKDVEGTPVPSFYMIVEQFPLTNTGKTDRQVLQKMAESMFGSL